jgi:hypothetical protein
LLWQNVVAILNHDRIFEMILDPRDVFQNGRRGVPEGKMDMHLAHLAGVRGDRQAIGVSKVGDLDVLGDAA